MKSNINQFYQLFMLNVREFFREPEILFWGFLFPISLALILGFAFDEKDIQKEYAVGIVDNRTHNTSHKSDIYEKLKNHKRIKLVSLKKEEVSFYLQRQKIVSYIEIFSDKIMIHYDVNSSESKDSYFEILKNLKDDFGIQIYENKTFIRGTRYIDFFVPGLIATGVMNSAIWGIGWSFIQLRLKKVLKIFSTSPMNVNLFFFSFVFTRFLLSIFENLILFLIIKSFFDIPFYGNVFDLLIIYSLGYWCFSGIAIFAGSRASNTYIGNAIMNAITLPMYILSGVFFSYQNLPDFMVHVVKFLPLSLLSDSLRSLFLEGTRIMDLKMNLLFLFLIGYLFFYLGRKIFVWK